MNSFFYFIFISFQHVKSQIISNHFVTTQVYGLEDVGFVARVLIEQHLDVKLLLFGQKPTIIQVSFFSLFVEIKIFSMSLRNETKMKRIYTFFG